MVVRTGERFFLFMGITLLTLVIAGFAPPVLSRPGGITELPILLHAHAAVFVSWFVLFCVQARLIGSGNVRLHMTLGRTSIVLAVTMLVLGYLVARVAYGEPDFSIAGMPPAPSMMFPFTDLVNFTIAYSLAIANRRTPAAHKRLMLLAGILIIDPAVARLAITIGAPTPVILVLELALFGALFTYDFKTRRKPHWASLLGLGLYIAALVAKLGLSHQSWWATFVNAAFG